MADPSSRSDSAAQPGMEKELVPWIRASRIVSLMTVKENATNTRLLRLKDFRRYDSGFIMLIGLFFWFSDAS
ncbi:hypothetical protein KFU94_41555 [Chloroflexi bacterium TSY]|nr:hypothetical protein [Chloroflexi bacterium TSY]